MLSPLDPFSAQIIVRVREMLPSERIIWDLLRTSLNDMILISPKLLGSLTQLWGKHIYIHLQRDFLIHCGFRGNFEHFRPTKDHKKVRPSWVIGLCLCSYCDVIVLYFRDGFHDFTNGIPKVSFFGVIFIFISLWWPLTDRIILVACVTKSLLDASWKVEHQKWPALPAPASSASAPRFRFFSLCFFSCFPRTHLAQTIRETIGTQSNAKLACVSAKGTVLLVFLILFACFVLLMLFVVVLRILFLLLLLCLVTLFLCLLVCFFCSVRLFAPWFEKKPEVHKPLHNLYFFYRGIPHEKLRSASVEFLLDSVLCQHISKTIW